jgi:hypothetical protein
MPKKEIKKMNSTYNMMRAKVREESSSSCTVLQLHNAKTM